MIFFILLLNTTKRCHQYPVTAPLIFVLYFRRNSLHSLLCFILLLFLQEVLQLLCEHTHHLPDHQPVPDSHHALATHTIHHHTQKCYHIHFHKVQEMVRLLSSLFHHHLQTITDSFEHLSLLCYKSCGYVSVFCSILNDK